MAALTVNNELIDAIVYMDPISIVFTQTVFTGI